MQEYNKNMSNVQETASVDLKDYVTPRLIAMGGIPHVVRKGTISPDDNDQATVTS